MEQHQFANTSIEEVVKTDRSHLWNWGGILLLLLVEAALVEHSSSANKTSSIPKKTFP